MPSLYIAVVLALFFSAPPKRPPSDVSALIAEARAIAKTSGDSIWPGFSRAPFAILLLGKDHSFLYCPSGPAEGFIALAVEPHTKCAIKVRTRVFDPALQATFAAVDYTPTVVIGMPKNTETNGAAWIATVLHEHFHQWQMSAPNYHSDVAALNLSGDNKSGVWMLNYPFPYTRTEIAEGFANAGRALAAALRATSDADLRHYVGAYLTARAQAFKSLSAAEARYAEFQFWQEGVARYSEIALAESAIEGARRGAFKNDYSALALNLRTNVLKNLTSMDMKKNGRVSFYTLGAGEALLFDRLSDDWRSQYFDVGMAMGPLLFELNKNY